MSLTTECILYEKERKISGKVYEPFGMKGENYGVSN